MHRLPLVLLLAATAAWACPAPLLAEEVLVPTKAYGKYLKESRSLDPGERKQYAIDYLEKWAATGKEPTGAQRYAMAQFQQIAEQYDKSLAGFRATQDDTSLNDKTRDYGATAEVGLLLLPEVRTLIGPDEVEKAVARLGKTAEAMKSDPARGGSRIKLLGALAQLYVLGGHAEQALAVRMEIVEEDPKQIDDLVLPIARGLLASAHTMAGYEAARKKAEQAIGVMGGHQQQALDQAKRKLAMTVAALKDVDPQALDASGRLVKTEVKDMSPEERAVYSAQRSFDGAQALMQTIQGALKPFALLGKPAPAWTLAHAFGDVTDLAGLKGKVVVLDFWATWPDKCSFPVMRDLVKEFGAKGLVVVGVTTTANVCYEQRYDIDEDTLSKASGARKLYAARLASEGVPADPDQAILEPAAYRDREIEAIATFTKNHDLPWPHVMIDKDEPGTKYAMEGWPGVVVLDKQGRMRVIRVGEVARSDQDAVSSLRKAVADLLAE